MPAELSAADSFGGLAPKRPVQARRGLHGDRKRLNCQRPGDTALHDPGRSGSSRARRDKTVIPRFTDRLVKDLTGRAKQAGARNVITYKKYPGVDHAGIVDAAAADATAFIKKALAGKAR